MIEKFNLHSQANNQEKIQNKDTAPAEIIKQDPVQTDPKRNTKDSSDPLTSKGQANPFFDFVSKDPFEFFKTASASAIKQNDPVIKFTGAGIAQGDKFEVDGPAFYNGKAVLKKFDANVLELNINMKATDTFGDTGFKIVKGKINLDIKLQKDGDTYKMITTDNNNNGSTYTQTSLKVAYGKSSSGMFSSSKEFVKISDGSKVGTTFTINGPGNITIKTNAMPISLNLIKQK